MAYRSFVHLRAHSAYSLAEGAIKTSEMIDRCVRDQMPAIALTDTGNLFGALEFSKMAASAGIQPIIGCQVRVSLPAEDPRHQELRLPGVFPLCDQLILLVQNKEGYKNLLKLVSQSYLQHPLHPHIPFEWLENHQKGLIALSGGLEGGGAQHLLKNQKEMAHHYFRTIAQVFENRFYIEITRHGLDNEALIENDLIKIADELDLPLVATNEAFFLDEEMHEAHDALLCIASSSYITTPRRRRVTSCHRLRCPSEMRDLFKDLPEAIENTFIIAQRCGFMVEPRAPLLPAFPSPRPETEELAFQAQEGLLNRLKMHGLLSDKETSPGNKIKRTYEERLAHEINIINQMGYAGYYLIVSDFIKWAKERNIPVGPGRGSGAGSLVAWALTITDIDPIRFGLLFERFLNPERISMPDFDIDFCQERRDEVMAYVRDKYGADRVAQIITFGKMQARNALRDVGRILGIPYNQVDRLSKMIPNNPANPITLKQAYEQDAHLQQLAQEDPSVQRHIDIAIKLEGLYRHASTHAAGIVIGDRPLQELVPLYYDGKSQIPATQFNMKDVEIAGLVKFDFLGLKTLTIIQKTIDLLKEKEIHLNISTIPLDDKKTFEMLKRVETVGIFQMEGAGMQDVLRRMQPHRFEELIALVALYRPGPMDDIPRYLDCKHGRKPVDYGHSLIEGILQETYGVMVYQEQVMQIAQVMGGYTMGSADLLRRAMGKKIKSEMAAQQQIFIDGAKKNKIEKKLASQIFDQMAKFAGYGFNKCHATPYALIAYQTAYLKANYPVEFMAATMTYDMNNTDKLNMYHEELKRMNITLLPPDINLSFSDFHVEITSSGESCIRYSLAAVKSVGEIGMNDLVQERQRNGDFKDIIDFARRLDSKVINKRMLENLICAGAFDSLNSHRRQLYDGVEKVLKYVGEVPAKKASRQTSLFDSEQETVSRSNIKFPTCERWSGHKSLQMEVEALGYYLSGHPLDAYEMTLKKLNLIPSATLSQLSANQKNFTVSMAGVVMSKKERLGKKGARYAFITFSDSSGMYEVLVFSDIYNESRDLLQGGETFFLKVTGNFEGENLRLMVTHLQKLDKYIDKQAISFEIYMKPFRSLHALKELLEKAGKGNVTVKIIINPQGRRVVLKLPQRYAMTPHLKESLSQIPEVESINVI